MNTIRNYSLVFVLMAGCIWASCTKDFIDLNSPSALPPGEYYKNEKQIKDALTGAYGALRTYYASDPYTIVAELPSDNTQTVAENESIVGNMDKLAWTSNTSQFSVVWNNSYNVIASCNIILGQIDPIAFSSSELKTRYIAETKFLRALMYFNLVRFFGDVPLVLKKVETEEEAYSFQRAASGEVYDQIEKDLAEAAGGLPVSYTGTDIGRATRGAALSLLGKVYLEQKKWVDAETTLKQVIDSKVYSLLPVYSDVFDVTKNNNSEIVFAIQFTGGTNAEGSNYFIDFLPAATGTTVVSAGGSPGNRHLGTKDLFDAFEPGDKRKSVAIKSFTSGSNTYYYTLKFYENTARNEGSQDWPLIRYADVLLMYAEALNEEGKTGNALLPSTQNGPLNMIRARAGLPEINATLSQTDARLVIEKERRVELCFEGHRLFDLRRTGRMVDVMTAFKSKYNVSTMQVDQGSAYKLLYPIPFREVQLNPKLGQNVGY